MSKELKRQADATLEIEITPEMIEAGLQAMDEWEDETGLSADKDYIPSSHADELIRKICHSTLSCLKDNHILEAILQEKKSL